MSIQVRDLEYFAAIAAHGQVQRAANALGLSQPALSKSLRRLEQAMNAKLLRRTPKGIELTAVGQALLARARHVQLAVAEALREARDLSEGSTGHLRIGAGPDFSMHLAPTACARLLKESPAVTFKITVGTSDVLLPALSHGDLDLTITASPTSQHAHLVHERVEDEEFAVYCSAQHRLAGKKRIAIGELAQERWILAIAADARQEEPYRAFAAHGLPPPRIAAETNSIPFRLQLLGASDLLTFLPRRAFHERAAYLRFVELPVHGLSYRRTVSVCYRLDSYLPPAARRFVELLKATAREHAAGA